ncbi:MAG: hypothetical protein GY869_23520 [Planctomycetes bacterium]|nr:hypothetical protein [Planctomycetota bacterium]
MTTQPYQRKLTALIILASWGILIMACLARTDLVATEADDVSDNTTGIKHKITWSDGDKAKQTISLFYDTDDTGNDGTLIVQDIPAEEPTNSYFWNTANIPAGTYHIYTASDGGTKIDYQYITSSVSISHSTACLDISNRVNLLPNSSFEEGLFTPTDWTPDTPTVFRNRSWEYEWVDDPKQAYTGERSIKIANTFNGVNSSSAWKDRVIIESPTFDLPPTNSKYLLTAWIKTDNVEPGHVMFRVKYYDKYGNALTLTNHDLDTFRAGGPHTTEWTQVSFILNPPHWNSPPYSAHARAEKIGINFSLDNSPGTLWVDDISLVEISNPEFERYNPGNRYAAPAIITASTSLTLPAVAGWSTTIQPDPATGVWWIVGPDQVAFWATGAGVEASDKLQTATGLSWSEYRKEAQYRSGHDLNFNQGWRDKTGPGEYASTQNYIHWLNFSSEPNITEDPDKWVLKDWEGNLIAGYGHYFPDVFSPIWQENAVKEAEILLEDEGWLITNKQTLGYWTDNEWAYGDLYDFLWGDTAKLAFVDWLQGKNDLPGLDAVFADTGRNINLDVPAGFEIAKPYTTPAELNKAWSSDYHSYNYSSFKNVYGSDKPYIRAHDDPVMDDLYAFERVIYKIYVDTIIDNIRQVETDFIERTGQGFHHPIFSNRFDLEEPAALQALRRNMDIFSRFDVIAINWYPNYNQTSTYHPREWMEIAKATFHDTTGRPLYIAEFGVAAEDADDYSLTPYLTVARWRHKTVEHQYQRGWAYHNLVSTWANLPYIIGANWFKWPNGYGDPPGSDPRNSGLVDDNDQYYVHLTDNMRSINKQIGSISRSGDFSLDSIDWTSVELNLCSTVGSLK